MYPLRGKRLLGFPERLGWELGTEEGGKRQFSRRTQSVNQRPESLQKKSQSNNQNKDCKRKDKLDFLRLSLLEQLPLSLGTVWALDSPGCRQAMHF